MAGKKIYTFHIWLAFVALSIPMLVALTNKENKPNLVGIVLNEEKPEFSLDTWMSGAYQFEMDDYNNDRWAYKEIMVKLNNQFYYDAFNQIRVSQFVAGKDDYVYAEVAINSYYGNDYVGEAHTKEFLRKCKVLQDTLQKKGITFLLAYAPGKGFGAPENIEDKYKKEIKETNIKAYIAESKRIGLNHVDFLDYFFKIKDTCRYPLYARYAHHWTNYFDCLATRKLIADLEKMTGKDLPDIVWDYAEISDTARSRDADVLKSMNLYKNPNREQKLAYPEYAFENDTAKNKYRMLTVGDSYWYGIVYMGVPTYCFAGGQFWYYNKRVVPNPNPEEKIEAWQLDLKQSIESNKIVMIFGSDPALPAFGWGFVEDAYEMYTSPGTYRMRIEKNRNVQTYAKQIRERPALLKKATHRSNEYQISLDSAIKLESLRMAGQGN